MINDNTHRLQIPEGEVRELSSPDGLLWERAVSKFAARLEQAYVTRNDGIKGLKAYGGSPVKRKADKLWGRYIPAVASDTTTYPIKDSNGAKFVKDIGLDGTGTDFGYYNETTGEFVKAQSAIGNLVQPVQYIQNNSQGMFNTHNIDTGIKWSDATKTVVKMNVVKSSSNNNNICLTATLELPYVYSCFSSDRTSGLTVISDVLEGNTKTIEFSSSIEKNIFIAGWSDTTWTGTYHYKQVKIYGVNDVLLRDFIPIRIGTTVYMLDLVEWKLYANSGTGSFTAGTDIPYTQLYPNIIKVNTGDMEYGQYSNLVNIAETKITTIANLQSADFSIPHYCSANVAAGTIGDIIGVAVSGGPCSVVFKAKKGDSFACKYFGSISSGRNSWAELDSNFTMLTKIYDSDRPLFNNGLVITATQDNCEYIAIEWSNDGTSDLAQMVVLKGISIPTTFIPYGFGIHTDGEHKIIVGNQGVVDLGSLNWIRQTDGEYPIFRTTIDAPNISAGNVPIFTMAYSVYPNVITATYIKTNLLNKTIAYQTSSVSNQLMVQDSDFTDAASFKAAMSGKLLFYQRTTDASFVAPQIKDIPMLLSADSNLDVQSGVKTEAWGIKVLDGTENINYRGDTATPAFNILANFNITDYHSEIISTHYDYDLVFWGHSGKVSKCSFGSGSGGNLPLWLTADGITTVADFKAYLADQYAKGTPVIILYHLATPVTEQVTIAPVTSTRRTTYVADSDSELGKLNITAEYLGK